MHRISVAELRRNATEALDAVNGGVTVVVTRYDRPIADLVPHRQQSGISGAELMMRLREMSIDETWLDDLARARAVGDRE